ncbi:hypothetical protein FRC06_007285 [Ceratobasidium sp. 370]|nr:hypothetical protein FRC06_007285 [Ceratobasidium sp. 370]
MACFRLFALVAAAAVAVALPNNTTTIPRACGTYLSDSAIAAAEAHFAAHKVSLKADASTYAAVIPVYWHVIQAGTTLTEGNIPDSQITSSIDEMNKHYAGSGLSFALAGSEHTTNADWFASAGPSSSQQTDMKNALRQGGADALNVYTVGFNYATFPSSYAGSPEDDGVVILYSSVPGGSTPNYNEGKTLTHEAFTIPSKAVAVVVSRSFAALMNYNNGMSQEGDSVSDTPPEASPAFGCPIGRDTCTGGGVDPIHNYMDYTYDPCMYEFTPGQVERFKSQLATYRGVNV